MKKTVRELVNECYDDERNWGHSTSRKMDLNQTFLKYIEDYPIMSLDEVINFKSNVYFLTVEFDEKMNPVNAYLDKEVSKNELGEDSKYKIYEDTDWNLLAVLKSTIKFCVEWRKNRESFNN